MLISPVVIAQSGGVQLLRVDGLEYVVRFGIITCGGFLKGEQSLGIALLLQVVILMG